MKLEVGKKYHVQNYYKKSYVELTFYRNEELDAYVVREIGWRSGEANITPQNQDEVDMLEEAIEDDSAEIEVTAFEEFEFISCWDGCWEDYRIMFDKSGEFDLEYAQEAYEALDDEEKDQYFGFDEYLTQVFGFEETDMEAYFTAGITVEEALET